MNWATDRSNARDGETRAFLFFALWPRGCADGRTRWLERVEVWKRATVRESYSVMLSAYVMRTRWYTLSYHPPGSWAIRKLEGK